jgi:OmpA-OmpF porin, OOP family
MLKKLCSASTLILLMAVSAHATADNNSPYYFGASLGQTDFNTSSSEFDGLADINEFSELGSFTTTMKMDDKDTAFKLFAGYSLNETFSFELGYNKLGSLSADLTMNIMTPDAAGTITTDLSAELKGFTAGVKASYPINDSVNLFAKLGLFAWQADMSGVVQTQITNIAGEVFQDMEVYAESDNGTDAFYGIGASYRIKQVEFTAEYEVYKSSGDDANVMSIGMIYHF